MATLGSTPPSALVSEVTTIRGTSRRFQRADPSEDTRVETGQIVSHNPHRELTSAVVIGPSEDDVEEEFGGRAGTW